MNVEIYKRSDGKYAWRVVAANGKIVATDGGQGYERRIDAQRMVTRLFHAGGGMDPVFVNDTDPV